MTQSRYVSRINQIDAYQLDSEIYKLLRNEIKEIAQYSAPGKLDVWQAEIDAVLKFFIWQFSLYQSNSSFGQRLLNLYYGNINRKKAILYFLLSVLPEYVKVKITNENIPTRGKITRDLKSLVDVTSNVIDLLQLVSLVLFLHRGVQPRLIELLLGLSTQSITTNKLRNIGYSYMTRELLWHGLMELFTIGIPMINFHYVKHTLKKWLRSNKTQQPNVLLLPEMDAETKCVYCEERPILPTHAGCQHIFCYYCMKAHFTVMNAFHCPMCDVQLHSQDMKAYTVTSAAENTVEFDKVDW